MLGTQLANAFGVIRYRFNLVRPPSETKIDELSYIICDKPNCPMDLEEEN